MNSIRTLEVPISVANIVEKFYQFGILNEDEEITNGKDVLMVTLKFYKKNKLRGIELIKNGTQLQEGK